MNWRSFPVHKLERQQTDELYNNRKASTKKEKEVDTDMVKTQQQHQTKTDKRYRVNFLSNYINLCGYFFVVCILSSRLHQARFKSPTSIRKTSFSLTSFFVKKLKMFFHRHFKIEQAQLEHNRKGTDNLDVISRPHHITMNILIFYIACSTSRAVNEAGKTFLRNFLLVQFRV